MRRLVVVAVLVGSAASAGPLPEGTKVVLENDQLVFVDHGVKVPLFDPRTLASELSYTKLISVSLDDGVIEVQTENCRFDDVPRQTELGHVRARAENVRGMRLHLANKYGDAIAHFATAAQLDPDTAVYATNLLSAQSMAKQLDAADQTLAKYGPRDVPWFAWRLAVDSDLANLRGRASTKPFTGAKRTKIDYAAFGKSVAVSADGNVALPEYIGYGMGPATEDLVVRGRDGGELARITVVANGDACFEPGADSPMAPEETMCTKANRAHTAANRRAAIDALGLLGFAMQPVTWLDAPDHGPVVSPDKQVSVDIDLEHDAIIIRHGTANTVLHADGGVGKVGFARGAVLLQAQVRHGCGGADHSALETKAYALP